MLRSVQNLMPALLTGLSLGFLVGAQVGPIWLLCARTSLRLAISR